MVDNCSVYEFELYESRQTHVAMECTNIEDFILISAGYHLEALEKELEKCIPDRGELVHSFNEVLDSLSATMPSAYDHLDVCQCEQFLADNIPWILSLEIRINSVISKKVIVNANDCWMTKIKDKYRLYHNCILRFGPQILY